MDHNEISNTDLSIFDTDSPPPNQFIDYIRRYLVLFLGAGTIIFLDQLTKNLVIEKIPINNECYQYISGKELILPGCYSVDFDCEIATNSPAF